MKLSKLKSLKENNILKAILGTIGVLIIGGLGGGVWELFMKPIFEWSGNLFLTSMSYVFQGYSNILHSNIGKGPQTYIHSIAVLLLFFFISGLWLVIFIYTTTLMQHKEKPQAQEQEHEKCETDAEQIPNEVQRRKNRLFRYKIPISILITSFYISNMFEVAYSAKASIYIERSIDILAPKIPPEKVLDLRAKYRLIDNAEKFYALDSELKTIASETNSTLPAFTVIK